MSVYQECTSKDNATSNTGAREQCLEGLFIKPALAIPGFAFASVTEAKSKVAWDLAIKNKQIFPLYDVEELAAANTEDTFFEGRTRKYRTAQGKKVSTFSSFLGLCSHSALKSFNDKEMQLFEFTEDGVIKGVIQEDGKVKGQDVVLNIGKRLDATADRPPSTLVTVNYKDYNQFENDGAILRPDDWGASDIFGIFDVNLVQVSASATVIKVKVQEGCAGGGDNVTALIATDFVVKNAAGAVQTVTFVTADSNGVYTLTGTGFVTGHTVGLNGVVSITGANYEAPEVLAVIVT
jgi:hypothetical protein